MPLGDRSDDSRSAVDEIPRTLCDSRELPFDEFSSAETGAAAAARRFRRGCVPVIGLIGDIGAGKSELARAFRERGAVVIDADAVGHELLSEPHVRDQIVERFGTAVLGTASPRPAAAAPAIDRRALGAIVFRDADALRDLESIIHPPMRRVFESTIERQAAGDFAGDARCIVLDAAILLEAGWDDLCDRVVYVAAPLADRLERVASQRGWTPGVLLAREAAQWAAESKRARADLVIENDAEPTLWPAQVDRVLALFPGVGRAAIETSSRS